MDYNFIKFLHIIGILIWASSASSLGLFMLYSAYRKKEIAYNEDIRKFYRIMTNIEIVGFLFAIMMGFLMLHLLKFSFNIIWLNIKIFLVFSVLVLLEIINFYFVNLYIPNSENKIYAYKKYDKFVMIITLPLIFVSLFIIFLATNKPF
ncbi:hypothetical protein JCM14244_09920 [Venenivibrio stagnispumantis]|uniref:Membrane protein n=1 Tax=Venenivibrio stagnispumantis TaxID=407998 RepID=A0AA45WMR8_9AQUI|nr:hypothetical protein [Venenivibrio stagnispumantis]MCW4573629.1 hypothetical protein [Venenivibrio stagnispumantis]SMP14253.1 putative membrane protein [Venenivibrio stagnispumantis]